MTDRVCVAPQVAMIFDPYGFVQACCANAMYPLGNVRNESLRDIWEGPRAVALRDALARGDFGFGCSICRHRLTYSAGGIPIDLYDLYPLDDSAVTPQWPTLLSFSLHNTCNLECIMCGGDSSSKIRTRRDGLPGLAHVYGERFFAEIEPFIERCTNVDFVGGEPFLVREHARIWELLLQRRGEIAVSVTTNGTVWNDQVERWLDAQDTSVFLSVDGVTPDTFEAVRVGASHAQVMANLDRFQRYTTERGTNLILSWSLVRANWHEFPDMLRWAEDRGLPVHVQTVIEPDHGVQRLPTEDLRHVVATYEACEEELVAGLTINRDIWIRELNRLRSELRGRSAGSPPPLVMEPPAPTTVSHLVADLESWRRAQPRTKGSRAVRRTNKADATADLRRWSDGPIGTVTLDRHLRVTSWDLGRVLPTAPLHDIRGLPLHQALEELASASRSSLWLTELFPGDHRCDLGLFLGPPVRDKVGIVVRAVAIPWRSGTRLIVAADHTMAADSRTPPRPIPSPSAEAIATPVLLGTPRVRPRPTQTQVCP